MASDKEEVVENFLLNYKGKKLHTKCWCTTDEVQGTTPKALLLILHGLAEHCLWYTDMAEFLNKHGVYVFAHDHVGHGRSEGDRVHVDLFQEYVDDAFLHADKIKKDYPNTPMFLLGYSMGGLMAIATANQRPDLFNGVILIGPLIQLENLPPAFVVTRTCIKAWMSLNFGKIPPQITDYWQGTIQASYAVMRQLLLIESSTFMQVWLGRVVSAVIPQFPVRGLDSKAMTRDKEIVEKYEKDPLVHHGRLKARHVSTMMDAMAEAEKSLPDIEWPFLILHGEADILTSVKGSKLMYEKAKSKDKQLKVFPDAFHKLYFELEPVKSETLNLIASWITERSDTKPKL